MVVSRGSATTHGHVNIHESRLYDILSSRDRFEADRLRVYGKILMQFVYFLYITVLSEIFGHMIFGYFSIYDFYR